MSCMISFVTRNLSRSTCLRNVGNCLEKAITEVSADHRIICPESKIVSKYSIKSSNRAILRAPRCITIQNDRYFHVSNACYGSQIVKTPPFAESVTEGDARLEKKIGDHVAVDEVVMEIETDKTSMPVHSPANGIIEEFFVKNGDTVKAGQNLFRLKVTGEAPPPKAEEPHAATPSSPPVPKADSPSQRPTPTQPKPDAGPKPVHPPPPPKHANTTPPPRSAHPSPLQKPAHHSSPAKPQRSESPQKSPPSGAPATPPKSDATTSHLKSDKAISKILETAIVKVPPKDPSKEITGTRTEQRVKMNRMRMKIAERLKEAQNVNAMLTTFNEIDMSKMMQFRKQNQEIFQKKYGIKLGFMSAFMKASAYALQDQPVVNAVIDGQEIVYRDYVDISVAVATPKGLVVPVVRNVERMNFAEIESSMAVLAEKARKGKIAVEDMDGGTFTISNGGIFGSLMGTPIINPPQSSILGMHGIFDRPIAVKGQVVIRPMMYVALTYDHRLIDGREAVFFLKKIKQGVEDPSSMLAGL